VFPAKILLAASVLGAGLVLAQQPAQQPPVKVNILNVCAPSADEQKELSSALAKVPAKPLFGADYEVARGHSTLDPGAPIPGVGSMPPGASSTANWVRVRREFPASAAFSNAQYSFSVDAANMVETLVLHVRDPKELLQISIEDSASSVTSASTMLAADTPVSRVKLERFGKSSVVLARCSAAEGNPAPDQSAYAPIFQTASSLISRYRDALGVRRMVPQELVRLGVGSPPKARSAKKKQ
jgi:hypothetical protein